MAGPIEAPNTLVSNTRIKVTDVFSEGTVAGFTHVSGVSGANPLCSVYLDGVPVMNGDGSVNWNTSGQGFRFAYTSGTSGQQPMVGFEKVEALVPLPGNTRVANPPPNNGYIKDVTTTFNTTMYPDAEGLKVTLRFPAAFTQDLTNGNTNGFDITWFVNIALNGQPFKASNVVGVHKLSDFAKSPKCTSPYLNTQVYTLPKTTPAETFYEWKVRVRRLTQTVMSSNTANDMLVDSMAVISSNSYRYPMSALVGLEMSADQFAGVPARAYDIQGVQVLGPQGYTPTQYNVDGTITPAVYPGVWDGTFGARQWTDNPAWIFYDLVTNKRYGLGNYVRAEWVDKWTLYQIAQYCDGMVNDSFGGLEPCFTCNVAILDAQDAYTLLNNLVSVFQGMLYWANGRVFPVGSEVRSPIFNFSNSNVVNGAFSYTSTPRNTRSTVCVVRWNDPSNQFRPTPERVANDAAIARFGYIEKDITAFATTSRGQALRAANWLLTVEQQLTETVSFQTDLEGLNVRPGDVFNVYDNYRNNQQQGGRLLDFSTGRNLLHLDRPTILEPGFTYFMSAIVPAQTLLGTGSITGSDQINLIRNSQIETRLVTTAATAPASTEYITVSSGFSSNLYNGSVWILSASGTGISVFDEATQYKCIATAESGPGVYDILGVENQTGINITINTTYGPTNPPVAGDTTPPAAPTGLRVIPITGLQIDNSFFSYLLLDWTGSASANTAYYRVSGQIGVAAPTLLAASITNTGTTYTPVQYGLHTFSVAAVNANGYESAYISSGYTVGAINPLGITAPLNNVIIMSGYDPYYVRATDLRYTGYQGTAPTFTWNVSVDADGNQVPTAQFITGYRVRLLKLGNESTILSASDIVLSGLDNNILTLDPRYLYTGTTVKPLRGFTFSVDTVDEFGNVRSGARLAVNNSQLPAPLNSGFVGYNQGFTYNATPRPQADTSGIYLWQSNTSSFTPTYDNVTYSSSNLAGNVNVGPTQGSTYIWYALTDTYGYSGSQAANGDNNASIYGPYSGNANQIVGDLFALWNPVISGTYALVTGINYAYATGDGALAVQINGLIAAVSGTYSKVQIVAQALVTGSAGAGWTNNAALARYGFQLDANGKVVSMVATSTSFSGSFGTIVFGGADLQSDTFSAGSAGWRIRANGDVDFNNGTFRGPLFINSGANNEVSVTNYGFRAGNPNGSLGWTLIDSNVSLFQGPSIYVGGPSNGGAKLEATPGGNGAGYFTIYPAGTTVGNIILDGNVGSISGRLLQAGPHFLAGPSSVDITGVNFRMYDASANQRFRIDNTNGNIYISGIRTVRSQYGTPLVTLTDVINCLTYHGLGV